MKNLKQERLMNPKMVNHLGLFEGYQDINMPFKEHFNHYFCMSTTQQTMSILPATDLRLKSIFELSDEELQERVRPAYEAMKRETFARGSYITYFDPAICPTTSHAVHEYSDRKELMWMDKNYQEHFVQIL